MKYKKEKLLEVKNLSVSFQMYGKGFRKKGIEVISDLSISVKPGEIVAVAGSSGSGKSILALAVLGILPNNATVSGEMRYMGEQLTECVQKRLRGRGIALIPQSVSYLDPLMKVGDQALGAGKSKVRVKRKNELFERLGLTVDTERLYPFQLSGGMARRVLFSTAIIANAELIIADEPTPGMHINQAIEALSVLRELANAGKGVMLITHDIDLAFRFADKIAVFYAGTTVEVARVSDFIKGPSALRHPYSKALWRALPQNEFYPIEGFQPSAGTLPTGCLFAPRCANKTIECEQKRPRMREIRGGQVRCVHAT